MTPTELESSALSDPSPPSGINESLNALWLARAGRWDEAHDLCQLIPDPDGPWIHAYLHREEGDLGNAAYWYSRAGQSTPKPDLPLEEEWVQLVQKLSS